MTTETLTLEKRPSSAGAKVTVACKMPNGFWLDGFRSKQVQEAILGGGSREVTQYFRTGDRIRIFGTNNAPPQNLALGGYALTHGVDKELWDAWLELNKTGDMVRNNIVFAYEKAEMTLGRAKEHRKQATGTEPIDPRNPQAHMPKSPMGQQAAIEPEAA
jgi:hypothetical protein